MSTGHTAGNAGRHANRGINAHLPRFLHGDWQHFGRTLLWYLGFVLAVLVTLNLLLMVYMLNFTLPGTTVGGQSVSVSTRGSYLATIRAAEESALQLPDGDDRFITLKSLGITVDEEATWNQSTQVSSLWTMPIVRLFTAGVTDHQIVYSIDNEKLESRLADLIEPIETEPQAAKLLITPTGVELEEHVAGKEFNAEAATDQIIQQLNDGSSEIRISPRFVHPEVTSVTLKQPAERAETLFNRGEITAQGKGDFSAALPAAVLTESITVNDRGELILQGSQLEYWLDEHVRPLLELPATPTRVTTSGSTKSVTVPGKDGLVLDWAATRSSAVNAIRNGEESFQIRLKTEKAQAIVNGNYPKTSQGLNALISDFNARSSADYWVVVEQVRGGDLNARYEAHTPIIPASTYKAFLSVVALHEIENGNLSLSTSVGLGTVEHCMFIMVHYSTNPCAYAIQDKIGAEKVDRILRQLGFNNTQLNNVATGGDKWTTAYDEYKLHRGLYEGTLLNKKHTSHLLELFRNQSFRTGIPAASAPDIVADKIGFLGNLTHDAGTVYGEKYDYVLVIMTKGGSFWSINSLAREINQFFRDAT